MFVAAAGSPHAAFRSAIEVPGVALDEAQLVLAALSGLRLHDRRTATLLPMNPTVRTTVLQSHFGMPGAVKSEGDHASVHWG
jgi:hypothetical protein